MNVTFDPTDCAPPGLRAGAADSSANEAMQARIVETAERLFRQFGYRKTTVADIADALGMSTANVYRFFASKGAITEAVARKVTRDLADRVRAETGLPGLSAKERLSRFVRITYAMVRERCLRDNRLHEMVHAAIEKNWPVIHDHKMAMRALVAGIVADGVAAGEFEVDDPMAAAACFQFAMVAPLHPVMIEHCLRDGEDLDALIGPMLEFAFRGLGAR